MLDPKKQSALAEAIDTAYTEFIGRLNKLSNQQLNTVPWQGGWTAGQVADHIIKGTGGVPDSHTKPADRPVDGQIAGLEAAFLNFDIGMQSPEFILPDNGPFEKSKLIPALEGIKNDHLQTIESKDLSAICMDFELPHTGHLTRYEWLRFFVVHCKRHTNQLERIAHVIV